MSSDRVPDRVTVPVLLNRKKRGQRITMLTAYDYPTALIEDRSGIDIVLVGDSVGTNLLGYLSPQQVTMDDMLHHLRAVRRGVERAFLLADMPFMSFQVSVELAVANAGRLVQEGGAEGVKLEGGSAILPQIAAITTAGVPVMGHLGFTPQSQSRDYYLVSESRGTVAKVQGRGPRGAKALLEEALRLEDAGVFGLVLEMVTEEAAAAVAERLTVPVIGIGAGRRCDGQVLTITDLIGLTGQGLKLAKAYADLRGELEAACRAFREDVEGGTFPAEDNVAHMAADKLASFQSMFTHGANRAGAEES